MSASHDDHDDHGHNHSPWIQHHYDDAQHQFDSGKLGIWLFLAQEVLFFSALFVAYVLYRHHHPEIYAYAHKYLDVKYGAINTAVLIFSSLTAAWAVRAAQLRQRMLLIGCLAVTILCAMTFLGIKYVEYTHKIHEHLLPGRYFDPCIAANESPLLSKNNECPGSKGSVVWNFDKAAPEIGCMPMFAVDQQPNREGVQAECTVTESEMIKIVDDKGEPMLNPDSKTALFFKPEPSKPFTKECEASHGDEAEHGGEACWKTSYQPAVCRPGWFYSMRCAYTETRVPQKLHEKGKGEAGALKQFGPYHVAPNTKLVATVKNGSLFVRKGEAPTAKPKESDCKGETCEIVATAAPVPVYVAVETTSEFELDVDYTAIAGVDRLRAELDVQMAMLEATSPKKGGKIDAAAIAKAKKSLNETWVGSRCDKTEKYSYSQWFGNKGDCAAGKSKRETELKKLVDEEIAAHCPALKGAERDACAKPLEATLAKYQVNECARADQVGVVVEHHDHTVVPASIAVTASCKPPAKPGPEGDVFADKERSLQVGAKSAGASEPAHDEHGALYAGPPPEHTNMFFTIYFAMTGLHGIHVLVGVFIFIWLLIRAIKGHFTPEYFGPVDWAALYWHIVDLIWIFLFPLMYLIH